MALTGKIVREQREKLGWKRPLLAEKSGLTIAQIAGIETGRPLKDGEEEKLRAALQLGVEDQVNDRGDVREPSEKRLPVDDDPLVHTSENPEYAAKLEQVIEENKGKIATTLADALEDSLPAEPEPVEL